MKRRGIMDLEGNTRDCDSIGLRVSQRRRVSQQRCPKHQKSPMKCRRVQPESKMSFGNQESVDEDHLWGIGLEKIFIDVMVDEVQRGGMRLGQFSGSTWRNILDTINTKSNRTFSLKQLKQKFNRLRQKHRDFSDMLRHTGFSWDAETNTVHALEETWQNYIQENLRARPFRTKGCANYKLLGIIFNDSTVAGILRFASTQEPLTFNEENKLEEKLMNDGVHVDFEEEGESNPTAPVINTSGQTQFGKKSNPVNDRKGEKVSMASLQSNSLNAMREYAEAKTECSRVSFANLMKPRSGGATSSSEKNESRLVQCVALLNEIPDLDDASYFGGVKMLMDPVAQELFLVIPPQRRAAWIKLHSFKSTD